MSGLKTLCIGSLDYSKNTCLDNKSFTWVRLRLLCDADGRTLWTDSFTDLNDVRQTIANNGIEIYDIVEEAPEIFVARAQSRSMDELTEWKYNSVNDGLCVRTFLTIINDNKHDLFNQDSCWLTSSIGGKSINEWFNSIRRLKSN